MADLVYNSVMKNIFLFLVCIFKFQLIKWVVEIGFFIQF